MIALGLRAYRGILNDFWDKPIYGCNEFRLVHALVHPWGWRITYIMINCAAAMYMKEIHMHARQLPGKGKWGCVQYPSCQYRHKYHTLQMICYAHFSAYWDRCNEKNGHACDTGHKRKDRSWVTRHHTGTREDWTINTGFFYRRFVIICNRSKDLETNITHARTAHRRKVY